MDHRFCSESTERAVGVRLSYSSLLLNVALERLFAAAHPASASVASRAGHWPGRRDDLLVRWRDFD